MRFKKNISTNTAHTFYFKTYLRIQQTGKNSFLNALFVKTEVQKACYSLQRIFSEQRRILNS